ncbi:MAG: ribonuclease III [Gammaproteobacteria bacterium]|nr:ribonuclease III [Gammaproteobacteria bacterium]
MRHPEDLLAQKLALRFADIRLLRSALTHRSAGGINNERLEFLGDSVVGFVIAQALYERFPEADEGVLSRLRAALVNQTSLAQIARKLELGDYLILGTGELRSGGFRRDSILSDAFEAVIGAVFTDQGYQTCRDLVLRLFAESFDRLTVADWKKDPKTQLQELMQAKGLDLPEYRLLSLTGRPHDQSFIVECRIALSVEPSTGTGSSRKRAEQQAAQQMLRQLAEGMKAPA